MTLATLTWNRSGDVNIPFTATRATYAEFLGAIISAITASTYWKVSGSNLDATNNRGYVELAPKSGAASAGRILIAYSSAAPPTWPVAANQMPGFTSPTGSYARVWVGFSHNAATNGPDTSPYSAAAYSSAVFSRMLCINTADITNGQTLALVESAEGLALTWTVSANQIYGFIAGRLMELPDASDAQWMITAVTGYSVNSYSANAWAGVPSTLLIPHILGPARDQYSTNSTAAHYGRGVWMNSAGALFGVGRTQFDTLTALGNGYTGADYAMLSAVLLGGGAYNGGSSDALQGIFRQVRWGPAAMRNQRLVAGGVDQAYCLNFSSSAAQVGGLWFDNQR